YYPIGRLAYENATDVGSGYFVLGDDSRDSQDSRFEESVDPESLCGRPWLIVWPLSRFGFVNP
ncbi:MAG TPA: hypothetical protein VEJ63_13905, partial [Planctomycetota bacterium]|nr:hypothetical protein [Planctomycetota bacterium]